MAVAEQPVLHDAAVAAFVRSLPATEAVMDAFLADAGAGDENQPVGVVVERMVTAGHAGALETLVQRHDFASINDWLAVGDRVMRAYLALKLDDEAGLTGPNPMRMLDVAPADIAAVAPYADAIERSLENN